MLLRIEVEAQPCERSHLRLQRESLICNNANGKTNALNRSGATVRWISRMQYIRLLYLSNVIGIVGSYWEL